MNEYLMESLYFGMVLSLTAYWAGLKIQKKFPYTVCNPLLIATVIVIAVLVIFHIDYHTYHYGAQYISYLLTPATVSLAVPMYKQVQVLKENVAAILVSLFSGCLAGAVTILGLSYAFSLDRMLYHSLQPKSITTAIAIGVAEELGGNSTVTVIAVVVTGLFGAIVAKMICRVFRITNPVAIGLACGNSAHAIGTSKALEFGEIEGAMSSLSIVVAGVITVVMAPVMAGFY